MFLNSRDTAHYPLMISRMAAGFHAVVTDLNPSRDNVKQTTAPAFSGEQEYEGDYGFFVTSLTI